LTALVLIGNIGSEVRRNIPLRFSFGSS
jgi:hypothetical protein